MDIKTQFSEYQYDWYTQKGFLFYALEKKQDRWGYSSYNKTLECLKPESLKETSDNFSATSTLLLDKKGLSEYARYDYTFKKHDENMQCYLGFLALHPKKAKEILAQCYSFTRERLSEVYFELFKHYDKKTMVGFLDKCLPSHFKLERVPEKIQKKLNGLDFSNEESLQFWNIYLKKRTHELKKPENSHTYTQFLLSLFSRDEEQLKSFFPYLGQLEAQFKDKDFSFREWPDLKTTSIVLNLSKMVNGFHIGSWNPGDYEGWLDKLTPAIASYFHAEHHEINYFNKIKRQYRILFSHSSYNLNETVLEMTIKDFFYHLKSHQNAPKDKKYIDTWLYQYQLEKSLPLKVEVKKSHKI